MEVTMQITYLQEAQEGFKPSNLYQWKYCKSEELQSDGCNYFLGLYAFPNDTEWRVVSYEDISPLHVSRGIKNRYFEFNRRAIMGAMYECLTHINEELELCETE